MSRHLLQDTGHRTGTTQAYGRITTIITPLFMLTILLYVVSFQLLRFSFVHATNSEEVQPYSGTLTPLLAQSHLVRHANAQQQLTLSMGLQPRNGALLKTMLTTLTSEDTHGTASFLTNAQYIERFSPTTNTYTKLSNYIKAAGFTITHTYTHRLFIDFSGTVAQAEKTFHTTINIYAAPDSHLYFANSQDPLLPAWLHDTISSLNGLNDATHWNDTYSELAQDQQTLNRQTASVPTTRCPRSNPQTLTPAQLANAYDLSSFYQQHMQGEGQDIALFEMGAPQAEDLTAYANCFGYSMTQIETIPAQTTTPTVDASTLQVESDAELILSSTPHLRTLRIYHTSNDETSYLAQWAQILADNTPVVATGWTICEQAAPRNLLAQENIFFQMAALQGQNIFAATGTGDQHPCRSGTAGNIQGATDPATQPYVIGVGGTTLTVQPDTSAYGSEHVWQASSATPESATSDSSGLWSQPAWQHVFGITQSTGSALPTRGACTSNCRETPDVALNADPHSGYWIYCSASSAPCDAQHPWIHVGGTASATVLWAAFLALTNEYAQLTGRLRPGFIAPLLYSIANNPVTYAQCFHDITADTSPTGQNPTLVGYDTQTGLGSYRAWNLAQQLVSQVNSSADSHNQVLVSAGK